MKRFSILLFLLITFSTIYAQPRVDKDITAKVSKSSQVVRKIVGWCYDENSQKWAGYNNIIYNEYKRGNNKVPITQSASFCAFFSHDIQSMQFHKVTIKGLNYYVLYIGQWSGYYDYPALELGEHNYRSTACFVLTEGSYENLFNLDDGINQIPIMLIGHLDNISLSGFKNQSQLLIAGFDENGIKNPKFNYSLFIKKEDDKTIRFTYPLHENQVNNYSKYDFPWQKLDFEKCYYETSITNWNLLKIK